MNPNQDQQAFAQFMGTSFQAMGDVTQGKNPVGTVSHGFANMPGMDPHASQMLHAHGDMTNAMIQQSYPPQPFPQQPHAYPQQPQPYPQQPPQQHAYPQPPQSYPQQPYAYPQQPPQQPYAYPQQPFYQQPYPQSSPFPQQPPHQPSQPLPMTMTFTASPPQQDHHHEEHHQEHQHHQEPKAMSDSEFHQFEAKVKSASFSDDKKDVVVTAAKHNWFTSQQVAEIVKMISFSDAKLHAAEVMYHRTVDKQSFYKVLDSFSFSSDKEEIKKRLNL